MKNLIQKYVFKNANDQSDSQFIRLLTQESAEWIQSKSGYKLLNICNEKSQIQYATIKVLVTIWE